MEKIFSAVLPLGIYREASNHRIQPVRLDDKTYAEAIQSFVIVCTDAIVFNRERRTVFLARRLVKPMQGWWIIGGRMQAGESPHQSMRRCFKRETSLDLPDERFNLLRLNRYLWKDREQEPQNAGSDDLCFTFSIELTKQEIQKASQALERDEYEAGGLSEFNYAKLNREGVNPIIIDLFDQFFNP